MSQSFYPGMGPDVATAPDFEIPRAQIQTPHGGEYAERLTWTATFSTDTQGVFAGSIYDVRFGYKLTPIRLTVSDPNGTYTPANYFSSLNGYVAIFQDNMAPQAMVDFGPLASGSPFIPCLFVYSEEGGPICRQFLGMKLVGPPTWSIAINGIGILREA